MTTPERLLLSRETVLECVEAEDDPLASASFAWAECSRWTVAAMALTKCAWTVDCSKALSPGYHGPCDRCALLRQWAEAKGE